MNPIMTEICRAFEELGRPYEKPYRAYPRSGRRRKARRCVLFRRSKLAALILIQHVWGDTAWQSRNRIRFRLEQPSWKAFFVRTAPSNTGNEFRLIFS